MSSKLKATLLLLVAIAHITTIALAGSPPVVVEPAAQPHLVARVSDPAAVLDLSQTKAAAAFGLDKLDRSLGIPGTNAAIASPLGFSRALSGLGAGNLWFLLAQRGGSWSMDPVSGIGWDMSGSGGAESEPTNFLRSLGLELGDGDLALTPLEDGAVRWSVFSDADTRRRAMGGLGLRSDERWRRSLHTFLERDDDMRGVGIWANFRPIGAVLTLFGGMQVDLKSALAQFRVAMPESASVELVPSADEIGIEAAFDGFFGEAWPDGSRSPVLNQERNGVMLELALPVASWLRQFPGYSDWAFFAANLDARTLVPLSAKLYVWRTDGGALAWSLGCLTGDGGKLENQLLRIRAWLEFFSQAMPDRVAVGDAKSPWGDSLLEVVVDGRAAVLGVVKVRDASFVILSGAASDWPNPERLAMETPDETVIAEWKISLSPADRRIAGTEFARFAGGVPGLSLDADMAAGLIPSGDSGRLDRKGDSLVLLSRRGALPYLIPSVAAWLRTLRQ